MDEILDTHAHGELEDGVEEDVGIDEHANVAIPTKSDEVNTIDANAQPNAKGVSSWASKLKPSAKGMALIYPMSNPLLIWYILISRISILKSPIGNLPWSDISLAQNAPCHPFNHMSNNFGIFFLVRMFYTSKKAGFILNLPMRMIVSRCFMEDHGFLEIVL